jgi:hypothetical protein
LAYSKPFAVFGLNADAESLFKNSRVSGFGLWTKDTENSLNYNQPKDLYEI